jgi:hypothetical protein
MSAFRGAFYEINGRDPTPEETKHALSVERIVKEAALDPILLLYLADTQAQEARRRGLDEVRRATGEAVDRFQSILPNITEAHKSIGALQALQIALERATQVARHLLGLGAIIGVCVGIIWGCSLFFTWQTAYAWARSDLRATTHQNACDDLSASIAMISAHWRKRGYPQAADDLGQSYDRSCR